MNDDVKKTIDLVQRELVRGLSHHIGTKPDPEAVKASVQKVLDGFVADKKLVSGAIVDVIGDTIRLKLQQPSFVSQILPALEGPYQPWPDVDGLVHVGGRLGKWNVRVCDFQRLENAPGHDDMVLTCLSCLTSNPKPSPVVNIDLVT
jgi:hypothetical protein